MKISKALCAAIIAAGMFTILTPTAWTQIGPQTDEIKFSAAPDWVKQSDLEAAPMI
jgi:hypothetical protein